MKQETIIKILFNAIKQNYTLKLIILLFAQSITSLFSNIISNNTINQVIDNKKIELKSIIIIIILNYIDYLISTCYLSEINILNKKLSNHTNTLYYNLIFSLEPFDKRKLLENESEMQKIRILIFHINNFIIKIFGKFNVLTDIIKILCVIYIGKLWISIPIIIISIIYTIYTAIQTEKNINNYYDAIFDERTITEYKYENMKINAKYILENNLIKKSEYISVLNDLNNKLNDIDNYGNNTYTKYDKKLTAITLSFNQILYYNTSNIPLLNNFMLMISSIQNIVEIYSQWSYLNKKYKDVELIFDKLNEHFEIIVDYSQITKIQFSHIEYKYKDSNFQLKYDGSQITLLPGTIVQLKGPNGNGKSTFLDVISGILSAKHNLTINGINSSFSSIKTYIMHQVSGFYIKKYTIKEIFEMGTNVVIDKKLIKKLLNIVGIKKKINDVFDDGNSEYSPGQLQRLKIANSVYKIIKNKYDIVVFDEPNTYIDDGFKELFSNILELIKKDTIIFIVDHKDSFDADLIFKLCGGIITKE